MGRRDTPSDLQVVGTPGGRQTSTPFGVSVQQQRPAYITGRRAMSPTGPAGSPLPSYYSPASPAGILRPSSLGHSTAYTVLIH